MTTPLPDDELRAMLEARADRVSSDAERDAMTTFRAAIRGAPDGKGGFTVIPQVLSSHGARLPWSIAALGLVVVVVLAVLGGRLSGNDIAASPSGAAVVPSPSDVPTPSDPGDLSAGDELTIDQLRAGIADGSLTGRVVVIDGDLPMVRVPCLRLSDCRASMPRVPGVRIAENHGFDASIASDVTDGPHVFIGDGVGLTYLGAMTGPLDTPMTAGQLADVSPGAPETEVLFVEGVVGPVPCFGCPRSPGPSSEQWLSAVSGTTTLSVPVRVPDTIEPPSVANRYLVRATVRPSCNGATVPSDGSCESVGRYEWTLVAAVGDEPILRVALP